MYKLINRYFSYKDERGVIEGLVNFGNWQEINIITSYKNTVRGGHFHKKTKELFYILKGQIKAELYDVNSADKKETVILKEGDIFLIEPYTLHTFTMLTDSQWINMLSIKNDETSPDIHKL